MYLLLKAFENVCTKNELNINEYGIKWIVIKTDVIKKLCLTQNAVYPIPMHRVYSILYNINKYFSIVASWDSTMWLLGNMKSSVRV